MIATWFRSLLWADKAPAADKPLIVVGIDGILQSPFGEVNLPLYNRLQEYKQNGAEIILAVDQPPEMVASFKNRLTYAGMDTTLFTDAVTPRTNGGLGKNDDEFWPKLLKRFRRVAEQVVLIDKDHDHLKKANDKHIRTFYTNQTYSSQESLLRLDALVKTLDP